MAVEVGAPPREQTRALYPDETGYVERDGVRVHYEVYGQGDDELLDWIDGWLDAKERR